MQIRIGILSLLLMQPLFAEQMATGEIERSEAPAATAAAPAEEAAPAAATESTTESAAAPAEMTEQSGFSRGSVVRSAFTTEISDREPTNDISNLTNDQGEVKFFTELRDMSGQTAVHRWEYDGKVMAEIPFDVRGPRWRVWSSKSLVPEWTGDWKVSVVNGAGEVISEKTFKYETAAVDPEQAAAPVATPAAAPAETPAVSPAVEPAQ